MSEFEKLKKQIDEQIERMQNNINKTSTLTMQRLDEMFEILTEDNEEERPEK